jgi:hypothetical protein
VSAEIDSEVRRVVYDRCLRAGRPPAAEEAAAALDCSTAEARAAFERLAQAHVLVLQPDNREILMAAPFSAVPTPFLVVSAEGEAWHGNCIWDALGVLAMAGRDGAVRTACPCCGAALEVAVKGGRASGPECVAHFALPARAWWDDIVYT